MGEFLGSKSQGNMPIDAPERKAIKLVPLNVATMCSCVPFSFEWSSHHFAAMRNARIRQRCWQYVFVIPLVRIYDGYHTSMAE